MVRYQSNIPGNNQEVMRRIFKPNDSDKNYILPYLQQINKYRHT